MTNKYYARAVRARVCSLSTLNQEPLPVISAPEAIPGYNGLVPITALESDLAINIRLWDANYSAQSYYLQAAWKAFIPGDPGDPGEDDLVGTVVATEPTNQPGDIVTFNIPQQLLINGVYLVRVRATSEVGGNTNWSNSIRIEVDTVAPGGNALPYMIFDQLVEDSRTVTDDDIENGKLWGYLAHYEGIARGDTLTPYLGTERLDADAIELPNDPINIPEFIQLGFNQAALLAHNGETVFFGYRVKDKAGNEDPNTRTVPLEIDLESKPVNLLAPVVPAFNDDRIISDGDVRPGPLLVNIPHFDKGRAGDLIVVHWGAETSNGVPLQDADLPNDPILVIALPYQMIKDAGDGSIIVTYEIFRNGNSVGVSPPTTVEVDLSLPGGDPDPDPTKPDHPNLLPALVKGDSGEDDRIPPGDYGKDAVAIIPWYAKDGDDYIREGNIVNFYWGAQNAIPRAISPTDVANKVDLEITIPASVITNEGSGTVPVYYTVSRLVGGTPPANNVSKARNTDVEVISSSDLPGGGTIDQANFPIVNANGAIGYNELSGTPGARFNPVTTKVNYTNVEPGDTVQLFFTGYDALAGGNPVPGATYTSPLISLTASDINFGIYPFPVSAQYHIAICFGHAEAVIEITNSAGSVKSTQKLVYVDVAIPPQTDCANLAP